MPDRENDQKNGQKTGQESNAAASLAPSAIVLLLFYIVITVAGHADSDLVRPDTQVSLETAAQKVNLPSGWFFTPFLGLKLSVLWFYSLAPIVVLTLHFALMRYPLEAERWGSALRAAGNVLAPLALFLMLWKFAPYGHSRPTDLYGLQGAIMLSFGHAIALIADAAMLIYASLVAAVEFSEGIPARALAERRAGLACIAVQQAGLLGLAALVLGAVTKVIGESTDIRAGVVQGFLGTSNITVVIAAAIVLAAATASLPMLTRWIRDAVGGLPRFGETSGAKEVAPMPIIFSLLVLVLVSVALPDVGRALNLAGAKLTAAEPSDVLMAAVMATTPSEERVISVGDHDRRVSESFEQHLETVHTVAWKHFGRGLDYSYWRFAGATFDGATMPLVRLDGADLSDASFIRTEMAEASLVGAHLNRTALPEANMPDAQLIYADLSDASLIRAKLPKASLFGALLYRTVLVEADLREANLSCVNAVACPSSLKEKVQLAQAQRSNVPTPTPPATQSSVPSGAPCENADGPKLDGAILTDADLTSADLTNASLKGAILDVKEAKSAKLVNADLRGATLKGDSKIFDHTDFRHACLCGVDLRKVDLSAAILTGASLRAAELEGATLPRELEGIDFGGANIQGAKFTGDATTGSNLRRAILAGAIQVHREQEFKPTCPLPVKSP